ncbi:MAG: hypothetical protein HWE15_14185 [Algoriphagus sp.]|uniref:hypothetical protein n=1 Tax=Algoriphagus sp. TaxID=1872435 RepID=UPI0017DEE45B|nr:hypothetical protein [Algoriphagus sp.]NVJ87454.1 hypothetical protein [Algoriphagus sp.]
MNRTLNFQKNLIIIGVPILMVGIMIILAKTSIFSLNPKSLSIGITIDLLFTVPLIYFLLIRKTNIPKTTILAFLILGMVVCSFILPSQNQYFLDFFKTWVFPIIELSIISYVIFNINKAIKRYKLKKNENVDFFTALKSTCYEILPKAVVIPVVTEIAVFYYGFVNWKKKKLRENEFSYHKESGTVPILITIIFLVIIETAIFHILLEKWSVTAAWFLTFLSIYSGIQLFGFLKSMSRRPIVIENDRLFLRYGIMNETTIDLETIDSIEISSIDIELNHETRKLSFLGEMESHNVIIRLKQENMLYGFYGIKRKYRNLLLHVDDKNEFKDKINAALQQRL